MEQEWIRRGARGDRRAQAAIVRAHQDRIYRTLLRLSGDREVALDLTQETFIRAFGALGGFRPGSPLAPWLSKIAQNLFLTHVRARRMESLDEEESAFEPGGEDPTLEAIPDGLDLHAALLQLPVTWRQAIVLRHVEDMSYDQIAEVLEVPMGTVKTWLFRGRDRLRDLMNPQEVTP